jgi:hypothetical protein
MSLFISLRLPPKMTAKANKKGAQASARAFKL